MQRAHPWRNLVATARAGTSRLLAAAAVASLACSLVLLVLAWSLAARSGRIPDVWFASDGNHGPWHGAAWWRPQPELYTYTLHAILAPLGGSAAALASWLAKPSRRGVGLLLTSLTAFALLIWSHGWLID
jgi:hypothetical protein